MFSRPSIWFNYGLSSAVLILSNLVPLIGVILFDWKVGIILVLYWLESIIIGAFNVLKILSVREIVGDRLSIENIGSAGFFAFHYGLFTFVHGTLISALFLGTSQGVKAFVTGPLIWTAIAFVISHGFSLLINFYGKKEYLGRTPSEQMRRPYSRVIVMHIVVIFSGMIVYKLGDPIFALILFIGLKIAIDLAAHGRDHSRLETARRL